MDKQLIEKIALEVANSLSAPYVSDESAVRFATGFLARIDAERGKEAVAWWDGQYNDPRFSLTGNSFGVDERPLFLSPTPTIPEGMVLVPIEPTEAMLAATSWPSCAKTDYAHMLAAAQGERK